MKKILLILLTLNFFSCTKETVTPNKHVQPGCYANPGGFGTWEIYADNTFHKVDNLGNVICEGLYAFRGDSMFMQGNQLSLYFSIRTELTKASGDTLQYTGVLDYSSGPGHDPWQVTFLTGSCE